MDGIKVIGPPRTMARIAARISAEDAAAAQRAETRSRVDGLLREIDAKIGPSCGWCDRPDLYPVVPPTGCPACMPVHNNGHAVAARARYAADWEEMTRPVADFSGRTVEHRIGRILGVR